MKTRQAWRQRATAGALVLLVLAAGCTGGKTPAAPGANNNPAKTVPPAGTPAETPKEPKPLIGYRAPEVVGRDIMTGVPVALSALRGQVVLLNFWATWCGPCRVEMPAMQELHKEAGGKVRIIAVGADDRESSEQMADFARELGLTFTMVNDNATAALDKYRVIGIPTSFFIDPQGVIRSKHQGILTLGQMREKVAEARSAETQ